MGDRKNCEYFSEDTKKFLKSTFKTKDRDGTGWLDADELDECLTLVGIDIVPEDMEFLIHKFDKNGDGRLQIDELMDNIHVLHAHMQHRDKLLEAFKTFDVNGDGYIRYTELRKILTFNGFMTAEESGKTISTLSKYDRNGDGKFSYSEFVEMFLSDDFNNTIERKQVELQEQKGK